MKSSPSVLVVNTSPLIHLAEGIRPWTIGTSVRVAKYMNAPMIEAIRLAPRELPPTTVSTHWEGVIPSWPGRPRAARARWAASSTSCSSSRPSSLWLGDFAGDLGAEPVPLPRPVAP